MRRAWAVAFGLLAVLFVSSCGGGGGGGGGDSLSYTGLTTPAVIDNTNAAAIARAAYEGGEMSDTSFIPSPLSVGESINEGTQPFRVVPLVWTLRNAAESVFGAERASSPMAQARPLERFYGSVSGYMDVSASWDDYTCNLSGSFSFHGYDDGSGVVLSGTVGFSGTTSFYYDQGLKMPGDILDLIISFSSFTSSDGIDTVRIGGTLAFQFNVPTGGPVIAVLNLVTRDEGTGKTVWIRNYTVTVTEGTDSVLGHYTEASISGQIYIHDYGYVDISTDLPFRLYGDDIVGYDEYPSSGILVVTGKDGCKARLTVLDITGYRVEVDANPVDGTYEWWVERSWV